jgi:hypothetical protein
MSEPRRIWWPLPGKLCVLERPGGGGRSHRPERRADEIAYLSAQRVRFVVSTMKTRHNLPDYEEHGLEWEHIPVPDCEDDGPAALPKVVAVLERELQVWGAVALHGNRQTDFVAAAAVAFMRDVHGVDPAEMLAEAAQAGLRPTPAAAKLVGVEWEATRFEPPRRAPAKAAAEP